MADNPLRPETVVDLWMEKQYAQLQELLRQHVILDPPFRSVPIVFCISLGNILYVAGNSTREQQKDVYGMIQGYIERVIGGAFEITISDDDTLS